MLVNYSVSNSTISNEIRLHIKGAIGLVTSMGYNTPEMLYSASGAVALSEACVRLACKRP